MPKRHSWLTVFSLVCFCVLGWAQIETWRHEWTDRFCIQHYSRSTVAAEASNLDRWGIYDGHVGWFRLRQRYDEDLTWLNTFKPIRWRVLGFGYSHEEHIMRGLSARGWIVKGNSDFQVATVPLWFVLGLMLILPVRWVWLTVRGRGEIPECACKVCRYDLRAHSAGQRCPECGTVIPSSLGAACKHAG